MISRKQTILFSLVEVLSLALFLSDFADGSWSLHCWNTTIAAGITFLIFKRTGFRIKFNIKTFLIIWILFIFHQSVVWAIKTFPLNNPEQVFLTLQMPISGFTYIFVKLFIIKVLFSSLFNSFFFSLLIEPWINTQKKKSVFFASTFILFAICNTFTIYITIPLNRYIKYSINESQNLHESTFFQNNYVNIDTVAVQQKNKTKNLILILMESMENSFTDTALGGKQLVNLIPELMPSDSNEYHFSHNGLISGGHDSQGTDVTISATIAKTTGCPLLLQMNYGDTLLEKVSSYFDILQKFKYSNIFIQGTDANFSGTKNYLLSHGINTLYDIHSLKKSQDIDNKYRNFRSFEAGITDKTILDISKHILDTLSPKEHFSLTIATIETHYPYGFYNKKCEDKPKDFTEEASLIATIQCASKSVRSFITWVKKQPFYPNTEIIILGDHLFGGNYLVDKNVKERRWYNLFINPVKIPANLKKEFTSVDIAPTILESLGFTIENHKMGFGVSLFSNESTLVEKIGIDSLNNKFSAMRNSLEYNWLSAPAIKNK